MYKINYYTVEWVCELQTGYKNHVTRAARTDRKSFTRADQHNRLKARSQRTHELTEHQPTYSFAAANQVATLTRLTNERVV